MVYIDWQLGLITNFFVLFVTLQLHHYFLKIFKIRYLIADIALSLTFGYIGLFIDDMFIFIFVLFILLVRLLIERKNFDFRKGTSLLMSSIIEVVLFSSGTYTARIIFFIVNNQWKLRILEIHQENFVTVSILINLVYLSFFLLLVNHFRHNTIKLWIQIEQYHLSKRVFLMSLSVFASFMVILLISDLQSITATIQATIIIIFSIVLIVAYRQLIFFVRTIAIQNETKEKAIYNKQLNDYLTSIQQQYLEVRKFKHDFQNIMLAMKPLVDQSDSDELKRYYHDITKEKSGMSTINQGSIAQISAIDSDPIRGLIIQKFFKAKSENIKFNLELTQAHYHFESDVLVIVRIIGILLDNALEYVQTSPNKEVTCAFIETDNMIEITIDNPVEKSLNFKQIFQSGYSTKTAHSGFGLANVRRLISESDNLYLESKVIHGHLMMTLIIVGGD